MPPRASPTPARILVVDDEALIRDTLAEFLTSEGFVVDACPSAEEALERAADREYDIALCDVQLPGLDGLELLERLLKISPRTFVLLITAYATVESAVEAFQRGAHDYLMKPILLDEVLGKIRRMLAYRDLYQENQDLRRELNRRHDPEQIVGRGPGMRRVFEMVRKVGPARSIVLITAESGTGKEPDADGTVPGGPVLLAQRGHDRPATAAGATPGHPRPGGIPAREARPGARQAVHRPDARDHATLAGLPVAGQRPRIGQRPAACRD